MARKAAWLRPVRRTRSNLYTAARILGNVLPWLEGDIEGIVSRQVNRATGRLWSKFAYGSGPLGRIIRALF